MSLQWKISSSLWAGLVFYPAAGQSEDWPNWRGPAFDGNTREALPKTLPDQPTVSWQVKVGTGFSTVSVSRGRVFTMGNEDGVDTVWCLDGESGKVIWKQSYPCALDPRYYEGGPSATPTVVGDAVFTLSKKGHAFRFDFETGEIVWQRDLVKDHKLKLPEWSFASSPFLHQNLVVLNCGGAGMALDAASGETIWSSSADPSGYATAVPFHRNGKIELLLFVAEELVSVDPETGRVLWRFSSKCSRNVNAADPIVDGKRLMISSSPGAVSIEIGPGENPEIKEVWETRDLRTYFNPSVRVGNYVYAIHGTTHRPTELVCLDWKTGELRWKEPGFGSGALMASAQRLIIFDKGKLTICPATAEGFQAEMQAQILEGKCWSVPVLANGRIYCRNAAGDLACVDLRP
jgi:outer membrane protein assembly factor BamB